MQMDTDGMRVLTALTQACSQNSLELKPAEQQLKEWESHPGFYSILLVFISLSASSILLFLFIVCCSGSFSHGECTMACCPVF
jgi:uncharacterized membrane protein YjjP (DUF1212 family)